MEKPTQLPARNRVASFREKPLEGTGAWTGGTVGGETAEAFEHFMSIESWDPQKYPRTKPYPNQEHPCFDEAYSEHRERQDTSPKSSTKTKPSHFESQIALLEEQLVIAIGLGDRLTSSQLLLEIAIQKRMRTICWALKALKSRVQTALEAVM